MTFFRITALAVLSVATLPFISGMEKVTDTAEANQPSMKVYDCSGCLKCEVGVRFKICHDCKQNRYCSSECQKADWENHKADCLEIKKATKHLAQLKATKEASSDSERVKLSSAIPSSESKMPSQDIKQLEQKIAQMRAELGKREKVRITQARSPHVETLEQKLSHTNHLEEYFQSSTESGEDTTRSSGRYLYANMPEDEFELVEKELSLKGNYYRLFLYEECIGALARKDTACFKKNIRRYVLSLDKRMFDTYPKHTIPHLQALSEMAFAFEFLGARFPSHWDGVNKKRFLAFVKSLEPHRKLGSLFLNKRYFPQVEEALELLRNKIIQKFHQSMKSEGLQEPYEKTLILLWVYKMACQESCLHKKMYDEFVTAVQEENHLLLLSCVNHFTVMRNAIQTSESFRTFIKEELHSSIDDFLEMIAGPFVPFPFEDFAIPERYRHKGPFAAIINEQDDILLLLTKVYYELGKGQAGTGNETGNDEK